MGVVSFCGRMVSEKFSFVHGFFLQKGTPRLQLVKHFILSGSSCFDAFRILFFPVPVSFSLLSHFAYLLFLCSQ